MPTMSVSTASWPVVRSGFGVSGDHPCRLGKNNGAIKAIGAKPASNDSFMNPETDETIRADKDKEPAGT